MYNSLTDVEDIDLQILDYLNSTSLINICGMPRYFSQR